MNTDQAIPVKFSLAGDQGLDVLAAGSPTAQRVACDSTALLDAIEETVTAGGSGLSYSYHGTSSGYVYVWKTAKAWAGTCRGLVVTPRDGSAHRALFRLR